MKFKEGVVWQDMHPAIEDSTSPVDNIFKEFQCELVVTSGRDSKHGDGSLHYEGKAYDARIRNVLELLTKKIKDQLGSNFDVILESDHIHIEFDPNHDSKVR